MEEKKILEETIEVVPENGLLSGKTAKIAIISGIGLGVSFGAYKLGKHLVVPQVKKLVEKIQAKKQNQDTTK